MENENALNNLKLLVNEFCSKLPRLTKDINTAGDLSRLMKIAQYVHVNKTDINEELFIAELTSRFQEIEDKLIIDEYAETFCNQVKNVVKMMDAPICDN